MTSRLTLALTVLRGLCTEPVLRGPVTVTTSAGTVVHLLGYGDVRGLPASACAS